MKIKESSSRKIFVFINTFLLCLIGFACVAPMIHVLFCSFSDPTVIAREGGFRLWPVAPFSFEGYRAVLSYKNVLIGYGNTLIYVFGAVEPGSDYLCRLCALPQAFCSPWICVHDFCLHHVI